jgi:hypothetical protein
MQEVLLETVGEDNLPRNVYYGDGTPRIGPMPTCGPWCRSGPAAISCA